MKAKIIALCILAGFGVSQAEAAPGYSYAPGPRYQQLQSPGPDQVLKQGIEQLISFMRSQQGRSPQALAAFLEQNIAPSFDFAYMARWAAGPAYRTMNETQRELMARKIKRLLLGTLAKRLSVYDDQGMRLFHSRRISRNEAKVTVGIMGSAGYPAKLIFRLYRGEAGWKVFDIAANGNSALAYYRRHFARKLAGRGR